MNDDSLPYNYVPAAGSSPTPRVAIYGMISRIISSLLPLNDAVSCRISSSQSHCINLAPEPSTNNADDIHSAATFLTPAGADKTKRITMTSLPSSTHDHTYKAAPTMPSPIPSLSSPLRQSLCPFPKPSSSFPVYQNKKNFTNLSNPHNP